MQYGVENVLACAVSAIESASIASGNASELWQSISLDAQWSVAHEHEMLLRQPLWLSGRGGSNVSEDCPTWVRSSLYDFERSDLVQKGQWGLWLAWYRAILPNDPAVGPRSYFGEGPDMDIAEKRPKFWSRNPERVMKDLAEIVHWDPVRPTAKDDDLQQTMKAFIFDLVNGERRQFSLDEIYRAFEVAGYMVGKASIRGRLNSLTDEGRIRRSSRGKYASLTFKGDADTVLENKAQDLETVPSQGPGPHFRANEDGLVDRANPSETDIAGNDTAIISQLRPMVLRCASELQARLSRNEFPELLDATRNYLRALDPGKDSQIEWGEVWGLGVVLQNAAASAQRKIENRTLPELEDPAKTALDSLLIMHGPMILATRDGAKLSEAASLFQMTREQQQALREAAQKVAEHLTASPEIITGLAAISVAEAAEAIGGGPHPERGAVYALATIKNISIVLIGGAAAATPAIIGLLLGAPLAGAVIGAPFSLVVVEAVKKNPAFSALVTQLGAKLDTMTDLELRSWMEERARRLAPFRNFVIKNREPLRHIAQTTSELKWMLKYIDFIVEESEPNTRG